MEEKQCWNGKDKHVQKVKDWMNSNHGNWLNGYNTNEEDDY